MWKITLKGENVLEADNNLAIDNRYFTGCWYIFNWKYNKSKGRIRFPPHLLCIVRLKSREEHSLVVSQGKPPLVALSTDALNEANTLMSFRRNFQSIGYIDI